METPTPLHQQRLESVIALLQENNVKSVIDLGCGPGVLLAELADLGCFETLSGTDICEDSLRQARQRLTAGRDALPSYIRIFQGSFMQEDSRFLGYDAAVLVETIEHVEPDQLSKLENTVFVAARPKLVIITTPNHDYNPVLGVPNNRFRHPDHRFEWGLKKFQNWCEGVAGRSGYAVTFKPVGATHPALGGPTQMAVMKRI